MFLLSTLGSVAKAWSDVHFQKTSRLLFREKVLGPRREAKREREENCPLGAHPEFGQQIVGSNKTSPTCPFSQGVNLCDLDMLPGRNITIGRRAPVHSSNVYIFILLNSKYLWVSVEMIQLEFAKHSKGFFKDWKKMWLHAIY